MDTRLRLTIGACLCLLPVLPLALRLAHLQVMEHKDLRARAEGEFSREAVEIVPRADILDRHGNVLAQSVPLSSCFLDKPMVKDAAATAAKLSPLLGLPAKEIAERLKKAERFAWLKKGLRYDEAARLRAAKIEGLGVVPGQERFYPNGALARSVLGQVDASGRGAAGLELSQEARLAGKPRRFQVIRDGSGQTIHKALEEDPAPPEPLRLTLDRNIQYHAEEALQEAARRFDAKAGMVAVQDPRSGEILAMAALPANPLRNPFVQDSYEPGSTFKVVAAAAALEDSLVRSDETFFCENGTYALSPGVTIHDHEPAGHLTLAGILEKSSNIGMAKLSERVGALRLYRTSRAMGFAGRTGIGLPGETQGRLKPLSDLTRVGLAAASYGYGIGTSPLQILNAYSAIANGGTLWEAKIVLDGKEANRVRRVASPRTIEALTAMLEGVVDRGTGAAAQIPGYRIAGKTGTARRIDPETGRYSTTQHNASFVGFLPADRPLWTILVVVEAPKGSSYGAQVAAPVFGQLARRLLASKGIAPQKAAPVRVALAKDARP